jgi:ATP-binding cassette subfamily F protein uup
MMAQRNGNPLGKQDRQSVKSAREKPSRDKTKPETDRQGGSPATGNMARPKLSFKQKHALETLPGEIAKLESEISKLKKALEAPDLFNREPVKFNKFAEALSERETKLEKLEEEWLELEILNEEAG